ncbi:MAG: hypothetical protein KatS3mg113_0675 [Planctomycetaceae bacterium]|nr:MAG: hypothetical protein KatS3mg113_0675 [Planctomycetaceae bacterium]
MTKKEIVKEIADQLGMTQLKTKSVVQKTFEAIIDVLVEEGRIELRNFGVFEVKKRAARRARNPRTGDKVFVPAKYVVTFKPGKEMEERVRRLEQEDTQRALQAEQEQITTTSDATEVPTLATPVPTAAASSSAQEQTPVTQDTTWASATSS